jgi:cytoskeletal protein CcmA (bactofilin family)
MALWPKETTASASPPPASPEPLAPRIATPPAPPATSTVTPRPDLAGKPQERVEMKESVIAAGLSIEGKITGSGHVRVAGKFKGDIQVEGNLHVDVGARVEGQVRASEVVISGELQGNIDGARRVELQQGGVITGDVKSGSLTVAAGSRMRGQVEFGWEDSGKAGVTDLKGPSSLA